MLRHGESKGTVPANQETIIKKCNQQYAGVQCALLTSVTTSTPIKRDKVHFPASESDLSEVDDPPAADVSSSVYSPSQESSQS